MSSQCPTGNLYGDETARFEYVSETCYIDSVCLVPLFLIPDDSYFIIIIRLSEF